MFRSARQLFSSAGGDAHRVLTASSLPQLALHRAGQMPSIVVDLQASMQPKNSHLCYSPVNSIQFDFPPHIHSQIFNRSRSPSHTYIHAPRCLTHPLRDSPSSPRYWPFASPPSHHITSPRIASRLLKATAKSHTHTPQSYHHSAQPPPLEL